MTMMSLQIVLMLLLGSVGTVAAFAPPARPFLSTTLTTRNHQSCRRMAEDDAAVDEEVEQLVQAELEKKRKVSNLRNEKGVEFAPWMKITPEDEENIRKRISSETVARRRRQEQERNVRGALLMDSQAQELSGTGLKSRVVDGDSVELEWATSSETRTKGFLIKRRPAKTENFDTLVSYENYGPLASKGPQGGVYRFLDTDLTPGGWVYRVTECEMDGTENDLSQCLVDIRTAEEDKGTLLTLAGFGLAFVVLIGAGFFLDPVQY